MIVLLCPSKLVDQFSEIHSELQNCGFPTARKLPCWAEVATSILKAGQRFVNCRKHCSMAISDTLPVTCSWANLPENIEYRIAQFLSVKDLATFCSLSKHHQQLFDMEGMYVSDSPCNLPCVDPSSHACHCSNEHRCLPAGSSYARKCSERTLSMSLGEHLQWWLASLSI